MDVIANRVGDLASRTEALRERISRVGDATRLIDEISRRTTILAVNASIEAARAGEFGQGFSTVADEVNKYKDKEAFLYQGSLVYCRTIPNPDNPDRRVKPRKLCRKKFRGERSAPAGVRRTFGRGREPSGPRRPGSARRAYSARKKEPAGQRCPAGSAHHQQRVSSVRGRTSP